MFIWKGHGLLIPVFAVVGSVIGTFVAMFVIFVLRQEEVSALIRSLPLWGGALAVSFYALIFGRTKEEIVPDSATHRSVVVKRVHSFLFIPAMGWAALTTAVAAVSTVVLTASPKIKVPFAVSSTRSSPEGKRAFDDANKQILVGSGANGYGNSKDAETLATEFSSLMKDFRKLGIEQSKKKTFSISGNSFLTYCHLNSDSCVFMVHVPNLRHFAKDAKEFIADMAWAAALDAAGSLEPRPKSVAVGIRGAFSYDTVIVGHPVTEGKDAESGIEVRHVRGSPEENLYTFFESGAVGTALPRLKALVSKDDKNNASMKSADPTSDPRAPKLDAKVALKQALDFLSSSKPGDVSGNNAHAIALAKNIGEVSKALIATVEEESVAKTSFAKQTAYGHITEDSVAYLLRVPGFDGMDQNQRAFLMKVVMGMLVTELRNLKPRPTHLAVGVLSDLGLSLVAIGKANPEKETSWLFQKLMLGDAGADQLPSFFEAAGEGHIKVLSILAVPDAERAAKMLSFLPNYEGFAMAEAAKKKEPAPAPDLSSAAILPTPVRDWKSADGRIMKASLLRFVSDTSAEFKREDGAAFVVAFDKLSAADQAELKKMAQALKR